jgi:hypothetical protein
LAVFGFAATDFLVLAADFAALFFATLFFAVLFFGVLAALFLAFFAGLAFATFRVFFVARTPACILRVVLRAAADGLRDLFDFFA